MEIIITGGEGFIGRNLTWRLKELGYSQIGVVTRETPIDELKRLLSTAAFVFHLAGVNRPKNESEFEQGNAGFTELLCAELSRVGRPIPVVLASSTQADLDNPYGRSKRKAEEYVFRYGAIQQAPVFVCRLTNVFGKWSRPRYNSVVATFCYQIARGLPIRISDPAATLRLLYIDDLVDALVRFLKHPPPGGFVDIGPVYETTVGHLAELLYGFSGSRVSLMTSRVGTGFVRALYSTYVSYLDPSSFSYQSPIYGDPRGEFVEMLKTPDSGQFSYFTAHPGVTRGEHYHHTKTEKFLVIRGTARFAFRSLETDEIAELEVRGGEGRIVETAPGWTHNITNIGRDELIVMLWANEVFDREKPDTTPMKVAP